MACPAQVGRGRASAAHVLFGMLCALALSTSNSVAQASDTVQLEQLTWTEIREAVHAGKTTIIIPIGGTEQSGPYVAVGKHNVRAAVLSGQIARQLGDALVAPVIAYVPEGNTDPPTICSFLALLQCRPTCFSERSSRWPRASASTASPTLS